MTEPQPPEENAGQFAERVEQAKMVRQGGLTFIHWGTFFASAPDGRWIPIRARGSR
jgi:hypothetical protein